MIINQEQILCNDSKNRKINVSDRIIENMQGDRYKSKLKRENPKFEERISEDLSQRKVKMVRMC